MKVLKFFAKWCGPCKAQRIEFDKNNNQLDAPLINLDIDAVENIRFANGFDVKKLPTTILVNDDFDSSVWGDDKNEYNKVVIKRWNSFVTAKEVNDTIAEYKATHKSEEEE